MTDRELMQQALEALKFLSCGDEVDEELIKTLRERLAQPEQKPIAWVTGWHDGHCVIRAVDPALMLPIGAALYTASQQRKPLTHPQIHELDWPDGVSFKDILPFVQAIEAAHGIGA